MITGSSAGTLVDSHCGPILYLAASSKDAIIRVWRRDTLEPHCALVGHDGPVNAVGMQNGKIVSASGDGRMMFWDIEQKTKIRTFDGHDRGLACIEFKVWLPSSGGWYHQTLTSLLRVTLLYRDPTTARSRFGLQLPANVYKRLLDIHYSFAPCVLTHTSIGSLAPATTGASKFGT